MPNHVLCETGFTKYTYKWFINFHTIPQRHNMFFVLVLILEIPTYSSVPAGTAPDRLHYDSNSVLVISVDALQPSQ